MEKSNNIPSQIQLERDVRRLLSEKGIKTKPVSTEIRKPPIIKQELFYDLNRKYSHKPDLMICTTPEIPCELKSPDELYKQGRYSRANLISILLMVIYGQCFSYADLFRPDLKSKLSIYLMVPKVVNPYVEGFDNIERLFLDVLTANLPLYRKHMELSKIKFSAPHFADTCSTKHYGVIGGNFQILMTLITYEVKAKTVIES